jgi:hypothetical protein
MVNARGGEEIGDLRALKISPDHHTPEDLSDFFPLSGQQLPPIDSARMLIAVGMPTQTSRIDYAPAHIHADTVPVACLYTPRQTSVRELHTVRIDPRQTSLSSLDLDGMSGAPVFSIDGGPGNYAVNFRGTILRGGNGDLHYIDAALIRRVLES